MVSSHATPADGTPQLTPRAVIFAWMATAGQIIRTRDEIAPTRARRVVNLRPSLQIFVLHFWRSIPEYLGHPRHGLVGNEISAHYNVSVKGDLPRPNRDRLGTLSALVLLAYGLVRVVVLPTLPVAFSALGLLIRIEFNTQFVMLSLAAALAVSGADWLIRSHPHADQGGFHYQHWVIPGLASLGLGAILTRIPGGLGLGLGLGLAAVLLIAVLVAEFIVVDSSDPRHDIAATGLRTLAVTLLIGAAFAIRAVGLRAAFAIPLVFLASAAVSWRLLRLGTSENTAWAYALGLGWVNGQIAWGLHYWPISPIKVSLTMGLVVYLGTGLSLSHIQGDLPRSRVIEFVGVSALALIAIALFT